MESLQFDGYTSYSDASTPRTPSPRTSLASDDMQSYNSPAHYKPSLDLEPIRNIFSDHPDDNSVIPDSHHIHPVHHAWPPHGPISHFSSSRGSLLQELYDDNHVSDSRPHEMAMEHSHDRHYQNGHANWSNPPRHSPHVNHPPPPMHRHDVAMMRRNTFPYVRQDREEAGMYVGEHDSFASRSDAIYAEPLPMDGSPHMSLGPEPSSLHMNRGVGDFHPMSHSPGSSYRDFDHPEGSGVKMEDHSPVIISSQSGYVHSQQQSSQMPLAGYMSPHGIPIQHTDDAASKETQYLRRRCFNCHTTEPPSWRRSTLTPGKIVCNKCGLYERTHLRPRPLRFDELRAGNKSRKQSKTTSPKGTKIIPPGPLPVKKEPAEMDAIQRRMSVSSTSSVQSNGASSDWDDGRSAPASGYNSPQVPPFAMPRDSNSQSPPMGSRESGIRLPNAPLSDIASMQRKPASSPYFHANSLPAPGQGDMFVRRTAPTDAQGNLPRRSIDIPEVTGWQTVPLTELGPPGKVVRKNSAPVRKAVAA